VSESDYTYEDLKKALRKLGLRDEQDRDCMQWHHPDIAMVVITSYQVKNYPRLRMGFLTRICADISDHLYVEWSEFISALDGKRVNHPKLREQPKHTRR